MGNIGPLRPYGLSQPAPGTPLSPGQALLGIGVAAAGIIGLIDLLSPDKRPRKTCGVCGRAGHDRRTCPHDRERLHFSRAVPKNRSCQCCGSSRYDIERHHTRGRASLSDFLDVCTDCHLDCCHEGHFQNMAIEPQTCRISGRRSVWRG